MGVSLLGTKLGMTRVFDEGGASVPVTIVRVGPCVVTQIKSASESDKYNAVQIGYQDMKPRNSTMPMIGHDGKAGSGPKRHHREFHVTEKELGEFTLGQILTVEAMANLRYVDVVGTSKGKGFAGTMKRHNFKGFTATHGTERKHRAPGSIGSRANNRGCGSNKKGIRMAGHMGDDRVTMRSLEVIRIDPENNLMLVRGAIPGANNGTIEIRTPTRLYKSKARKQAEKAKG